MEKLKTLSEFVTDVEKYANESHNYQRATALIFEYNEWLNQEINENMFLGDNPLFADFWCCPRSRALELNIEKCFYPFGKEWQVTIKRLYGKEHGMDNKMRFVTSMHLKTISDLAGKIEEYNNTNKEFGHTNFADF